MTCLYHMSYVQKYRLDTKDRLIRWGVIADQRCPLCNRLLIFSMLLFRYLSVNHLPWLVNYSCVPYRDIVPEIKLICFICYIVAEIKSTIHFRRRLGTPIIECLKRNRCADWDLELDFSICDKEKMDIFFSFFFGIKISTNIFVLDPSLMFS